MEQISNKSQTLQLPNINIRWGNKYQWKAKNRKRIRQIAMKDDKLQRNAIGKSCTHREINHMI